VATSSVIPILIGALRIPLPLPDTRPHKMCAPDIRPAIRFGWLRHKDRLETAKAILPTVGLINPEMRRIVEEQRLGFADDEPMYVVDMVGRGSELFWFFGARTGKESLGAWSNSPPRTLVTAPQASGFPRRLLRNSGVG
jgi:hypothetical protein